MSAKRTSQDVKTNFMLVQLIYLKQKLKKYVDLFKNFSSNPCFYLKQIYKWLFHNFLKFIVVMLVYHLLKDPLTVYYNGNIDEAKLKRDIDNKFLFQTNAKTCVFKAIENVDKWPTKKIIALMGSGGVGKTYLTDIIKSHFCQLVVHVYSADILDIDRYFQELHQKLYWYSRNVIIIDNLNVSHVPNLLSFLDKISDTYQILLLAIFSTQTVDNLLVPTISLDDIPHIEFALKKADLETRLCVFDQYDSKQVSLWISKQLTDLNVAEDKHNLIKERVLYKHDIKYQGMKGLYSKILVAV